MATKTATNIFVTAKEKASKAPTKKNDKRRILIKDKELSLAIQSFNSSKEEIDRQTAILENAQSIIKAQGRKTFLDVFRNEHKNPDSFIIEDGQEHAIMYLPTDKYLSIDEERAVTLIEKYGDEFVTENTEFIINKDLLEKNVQIKGKQKSYGEILSNLIQGCKEFEEHDKENIIKATVKYQVSKGSIDKLDNTQNMGEMFDDLGIVVQLKRTK